jgi:outer membrane biosynthesis protein TonB
VERRVAAPAKKSKPAPKPTTSSATKGKKDPAPKKKESKANNKRSKKSSGSDGQKSAAVPARRKTKVRKAALDKTGNLASEILDMLLSTEEESNGEEGGADSSDGSWK